MFIVQIFKITLTYLMVQDHGSLSIEPLYATKKKKEWSPLRPAVKVTQSLLNALMVTP